MILGMTRKAFTKVSRLRNYGMRSAASLMLFTGSELLMAITCVGGPILLCGTCKTVVKTTFHIVAVEIK
jgi:hypothetical protein